LTCDKSKTLLGKAIIDKFYRSKNAEMAIHYLLTWKNLLKMGEIPEVEHARLINIIYAYSNVSLQ